MKSSAFVKSAAAVMVLLLAGPSWAQSATVAVFPATATDPNLSAPLAVPTSYVPTCGLSPKFTEVTPITDPFEGYYDDPADASKDCRVGLSTQFAALPAGSGYKAAVKVGGGPFGPFSTSFAMSAAQVVPTITAGQSFTVRASHSCLNATAYRLYIDSVQVGANLPTSACASGVITATSPGVTAGTHAVLLAAVDSVGELRGPSLTITAQSPRTVAPGVPTVTQP